MSDTRLYAETRCNYKVRWTELEEHWDRGERMAEDLKAKAEMIRKMLDGEDS